LLHIKGKKLIRVHQVELIYKSLNSGDCFILDATTMIFQWNGKLCNSEERWRATQLLSDIITERAGKPISYNIDEGEEVDEFWEILGGKGIISEPTEDEHITTPIVKNLFKLSDASGALTFTLISTNENIKFNMLQTEDVFLLDTGIEIFVWVGKGASINEKRNAIKSAQNYLLQNNRTRTSITRQLEGGESDYFKGAFN